MDDISGDGGPLPITKNRLIHDLEALGVHAGQTIMLHASVKNVG